MTPEERQAEALARWLDGPRDAPPPDLDPEIVEVVTTLQTDRIPAPRVTAEEILASVTAGPLAAGGGERAAASTAPDGRGSGAADGAASLDLADATIPAPANRPGGPARRPWIPVVFGGGAAVALAAALALVAILPRFVADEAPQDLAQAPAPAAPATEGLSLREVPAEEAEAERSAAASAPAASGSGYSAEERPAAIARAAPTTAAAPPPPAADPSAGAGSVGNPGGAASGIAETATGRASPKPAEEPAVADLDEELEPDLAEESDDLRDAPSELDALDGGYATSGTTARAQTDANVATRSTSGAVATEDLARAPRQRAARGSAPKDEKRAEGGVAAAGPSADSAPDLALAARPPGPLSAVALPIKRRLDEGDARGAVDAATTELKRRDLDRPSRADLHYVRGLAWRALGRTADADADFRDAARLR